MVDFGYVNKPDRFGAGDFRFGAAPIKGGGIRGAYNFTSATLPMTVAGVLGVQAGTADFRIGGSGDSTMLGAFAGTGANPSEQDAYQYNVTAYLAKYLASHGVPANYSGRMGDGARGDVNSKVFDSRISFPVRASQSVNGWWTKDGATVLGSEWFEMTGVVNLADVFGVLPIEQCDSVRVFYYQQSGFGAGTFQLGDGDVVPVNQSGTSSIRSVVLTSGDAPGFPQLKVLKTSGGAFNVGGWEFFDSTKKQVIVTNLAAYGSGSGVWATNGQYRYPPVAIANANIKYGTLLYNIGINDARNAMDLAVSKANSQVFLGAHKAAGGDGIILTPLPISTTVASLERQLQQDQISIELANENGFAYVNTREILGSHENMVANGWNADDVHAKAIVYQMIGETIAKGILKAAGLPN